MYDFKKIMENLPRTTLNLIFMIVLIDASSSLQR